MKTTILEKITTNKRIEIAEIKGRYKLSDYESMPLFDTPTKSLKQALEQHDFGIIAEFKRKSPSAGLIRGNANPVLTAKTYEKSGAAAISCLTDSKFFQGSLKDFTQIRNATKLPLLRKDFILDEIQVFEAKAHGADAILLISEILDPLHSKHLTIIAQSLGMEVLMEAHDREHLLKINDLVDVIGINNRNLHLQKTDLQTSANLFDFIPRDVLCISESGVKSVEDLNLLADIGFRGALVGETLMKSNKPELFISKSPVSCL